MFVRTYKEWQDTVRPIIVTLLSNIERRVLQAAWVKKEVKLQDTSLFFDHDFTCKVREQISQYKHITAQLKARNIKTHILNPVKLKVFNNVGATTILPTSAAPAKELERKGSENRH